MSIIEFLGLPTTNEAELIEVYAEFIKTQQRAIAAKNGVKVEDIKLSGEDLIKAFFRSQLEDGFTKQSIIRSRRAGDAKAKDEALTKLKGL